MLALTTRLSPARLGRLGERRAAWHYRLRGWTILHRNLRTHAGEIDLVVRRRGVIAIVEVKTRQTFIAGEGYEAVTRAKRERMFRLGDRLAAQHPTAQLRYDIVSVRWTGWRFVTDVYVDAFRPLADAQRPWKWRG